MTAPLDLQYSQARQTDPARAVPPIPWVEELPAPTRRAAVRTVAGWPGLTAPVVAELLAALGLTPEESS